MPVYEFRCQECGRLARLTYSFSEYDEATPVCPHCGSEKMNRRIGRVALGRSEEAHMDSMLDENALAGLDEEDPQALGRFMRKMSREMGEELGDEFEEVVDRLEKGQSPEQIEEALPELADDAGAGADPF